MESQFEQLVYILGFLGLWIALTVGFFFLITYPVWIKKVKKPDWLKSFLKK